MAINWGKSARAYCKIRLTVGIVIAVIVGLILVIGGIVIRMKSESTSSYLPVESAIKSSSVSYHRNKYRITHVATYTIGGVKYTVRVPGASDIVDRAAADALVKDAVGKTVTVWYDPADPTKVTPLKHGEKYLLWGMLGFGAVSLLGAGVTYALRDNPVMCGMQVTSNVSNALFG